MDNLYLLDESINYLDNGIINIDNILYESIQFNYLIEEDISILNESINPKDWLNKISTAIKKAIEFLRYIIRRAGLLGFSGIIYNARIKSYIKANNIDIKMINNNKIYSYIPDDKKVNVLYSNTDINSILDILNKCNDTIKKLEDESNVFNEYNEANMENYLNLLKDKLNNLDTDHLSLQEMSGTDLKNYIDDILSLNNNIIKIVDSTLKTTINAKDRLNTIRKEIYSNGKDINNSLFFKYNKLYLYYVNAVFNSVSKVYKLASTSSNNILMAAMKGYKESSKLVKDNINK
jgi:hypothetical protein